MAPRKRKEDISLTKIVLVICLLVAVAYGIHRGAGWFRSYVGEDLEAAAPDNLASAREHLEANQAAEARDLLLPITERVENDAITPQALMLLAEAEQKLGNNAGALACLKRAMEDFPTSTEQPRAAVAYARFLEDTGDYEECQAIYASVKENAIPELRAPALSGLARQAERAEKPEDALALYRQGVSDAKWNTPAWDEAAEGLGRLNVKQIFSIGETAESRSYTVEKGDSLTSIGMKLNTTRGLLTRANGIAEDATLRLKQRLKYTPRDFRIVIERSTCRMFLFDKGGLFKRYSTGLGRKGHETALGVYKIGNKVKDPTWHKPGGGPIPPGDPRNELGVRWMPLVPEREDLPSDLGIHEAVDPTTAGKYSSSGCARLVQDEVVELYDLIVRSTPVEIVEIIDPQSLP